MADLILFDGTCAFCHGFVRFMLARDGARRYQFAPRQGTTAAQIHARHAGLEGAESVVLVEAFGTPAERVHLRSTASLRAVAGLGGAWKILSLLLFVPVVLRDAGYRVVAAVRHRLAGRADLCKLPGADDAGRLLP